jgi:hypothetical protein
MPHVTHTPTFEKLLKMSSFTVIGAFLVCQIYDYDIWWHVAIGRDILVRRAVPTTDHFAAFTFGRPYYDSQWLYQVVVALADQAAGMVGVQVVMILAWGATLFLCHHALKRWATPLAGTLLLFLAAMASTERFLPRPEIITLLMIAAFYWMLQDRRYLRVYDVLIFGLLQAVWVNAHGLFVIGPFMVGCYWLVAALRRTQGGEPDFVPLSRLLGVVTAATLLSPYGAGGWYFTALLLYQVSPEGPSLLRTVGEMSPTFGLATRSGMAFWFFAALLFVTIVAATPVALRCRISVARLLIVGGLFAVSLTARRNIPPFVLVAAPFAAENLRLLSFRGIANDRTKAVASVALTMSMLAMAGYSLSGTYWLNSGIPSRCGWGVTPTLFPRALPEVLDRIGFEGQVLNSHSLGGFYLYHGYPRRLPLVDNRFELVDMKVLAKLFDSLGKPAEFASIVAAYDIRGLLLQHISAESKVMLPMLRLQDTWRLVYFDHAVSFWMHIGTPKIPAAIDLGAATLLSRPSRFEDCSMLNVFLNAMEAYDLKLQNLQDSLVFNWDVEKTLTDIGQTQMRLQRFDQAENTYQRLVRDYPRNLSALNDLGVLAYQKGDTVTAERMLRRALEISPDNADFRTNYQLLKQQE